MKVITLTDEEYSALRAYLYQQTIYGRGAGGGIVMRVEGENVGDGGEWLDNHAKHLDVENAVVVTPEELGSDVLTGVLKDWKFISGDSSSDRFVMQSGDGRFLLIGEYYSFGDRNTVRKTIRLERVDSAGSVAKRLKEMADQEDQ